MIKKLIRTLFKPNWYNLRNLSPISKSFALNRGTPIDRFYIEEFLSRYKFCIKGTVLEIADSFYSRKFDSGVSSFEVLHFSNTGAKATIIGDLTDTSTIPAQKADCFICTQTLNFIYDYKKAINGIHHILKKNGVALVTVSGISQISRYDMNRWGDYWRFTDRSMVKTFEEVFGIGNVEVQAYGNVLTATAFLQGISTEELTPKEISFIDNDYQVIIAIKAIKRELDTKDSL